MADGAAAAPVVEVQLDGHDDLEPRVGVSPDGPMQEDGKREPEGVEQPVMENEKGPETNETSDSSMGKNISTNDPSSSPLGAPVQSATAYDLQERPVAQRLYSTSLSQQTESSIPSTPRQRTDSQSTGGTTITAKSTTRSSTFFVVTALESIAASKDAKKRKPLADAAQRALTTIKNHEDPSSIDPEILFAPLQLATEANTISIVTTALDCVGKLISYSYFSVPAESGSVSTHPIPLIERAIDTICDCFQGEATPVEVQLQIIKSLLAAILNDKIVVHGAGLLKAIRQTYNIFLFSKSSANQQVAQGALTQMIGTAFERVKIRMALKEARLNPASLAIDGDADASSESVLRGSVPGVDGPIAQEDGDGDGDGDGEQGIGTPVDVPQEKDAGTKITLQSFENRKSFDDERIRDNDPTMVTQVRGRLSPPRPASGSNVPSMSLNGGASETQEAEEEDEIYIKDAFLVFRAMCKLSTKTLPADQIVDVKSHGMRSKLLSLHIIHNVLHNHVAVFVSPLVTLKSGSNEPTSFVQAIKQYLCLALSRNGSSSISRVFEVGCEIFWLMLKHLRVMLKKEIEVFLKEIYFSILDKRTAPAFQKHSILTMLQRLAADPRALVEVYLNYDCDRTALDNMFQRSIEHLSRISSTPVSITSVQVQTYLDHKQKASNASSEWQVRGTIPSLSTATISHITDLDQGFPADYALKQQSMECLVQALRSLVKWTQQGGTEDTAILREAESRNSLEDLRVSLDTKEHIPAHSPHLSSAEAPSGPATPLVEDDPGQLEWAKQRKTALLNGIRQFNFKPKRGIKVLIKEGFIPSESPEDIAQFLFENPSLDKKALGEYLGEGEPENIAIMHAFFDLMNFTKTRFVDALRRCLQAFRLPGEAQKIDRIMLKFAERYISGNPNAFANADTAYVLAYSVIMLNTDQHSTKMKGRRMTVEDFIKNNRGINDNANLPDEYLRGIFDEIAHNEIVLATEREVAANLAFTNQASGGLAANIGQALSTVGRDLQREAYMQASEQMANKTEQLFRSLLRAQRRNAVKMPATRFIPASSFRHVGPMFDVTWMPFLTALTGQAQEAHNIETIRRCMEGLRLAIRIACFFDLQSPRQAFVQALSRFTNLYNLNEMKAKNLEALKVLLEVAQTEGDFLKESWRDILTCISQLDRFQLISTGVDEGMLPDVNKLYRNSTRTPSAKVSRRSAAPPLPRQYSASTAAQFQPQIAEESRSAEMVRRVDQIFTNSAKLSGNAIVHFIRALTQVSWQEIQSSGQSESPRTYSLQKLVEISGYNMERVRFEWTNIWQVLGEHFIQVGCHTNTIVVEFAIDSLRQLSMKFLDKEELPGFQFQKDFLKPFEHIISNTAVVKFKDMVLRCLIQMIQVKGANIRSGWRTMFGVFTVAAREPYESVVNLAFENVTHIYNTRLGMVIPQGAFADLIVCLTEFSKNPKFQRKALQAVETLRSCVPKMLQTPECPLSSHSSVSRDSSAQCNAPKQPSRQTQEEQYWFPVLFAFHDILMTGDDLEVRSRALNYLFDTLTKYGKDFPRDFWDILWRQLLYPIFMVLKSKSEMTKAVNHEELSVWLSTTMIQALRSMVALFTHYFDSLEYMLDRFLDLLALCICQENDTLARIGSNCLQSIIIQNVTKFTSDHWNKIVSAFVDLFARTEASALFSAATASYAPSAPGRTNGASFYKVPPNASAPSNGLPTDTPNHEMSNPMENALGINGLSHDVAQVSVTNNEGSAIDSPTDSSPSPDGKQPNEELEDYRPDAGLQQAPVVVTAARRRFFNQIITKCVLQLLMIETVNELFSIDAVYAQIPSPELLRLMGLLKKSFQFAKRFNSDRELRTRLFKEGFMKQPPNLLKQESGSAAVYISILFRMYHDEGEERKRNRADTEAALIPLCVDIVNSYIQLDEETQQRNIVTWRPVVVDVMEGFTNFPLEGFQKNIKVFMPLAIGLLSREMGLELQRAVQGLLQRVAEVEMGLPPTSTPLPTSTSPRASMFGRRSSRGR